MNRIYQGRVTKVARGAGMLRLSDEDKKEWRGPPDPARQERQHVILNRALPLR